MTYEVAVIGTGENPDDPGPDGYAMAYHHANSFEAVGRCELISCADIIPENAAAFAETYDIGEENIFTDYEVMVAETEPDIVSVCVPPAIHAEIVNTVAKTGIPDAIHCEKPMARSWAECREMVEVSDANDVQLTFNHQRRYGRPFTKAKELLDDGDIGDLERVEFSAPGLYDYGSHSFDLCGMFAGDVPAEWVIAQIDYRDEQLVFGAHNENQGLVQWQYENGVDGLATTGFGADCLGVHHRLVGSEGVIEVDQNPALRMKRDGEGQWETIDCDGEGLHGWQFVDRAIEDLINGIETGKEPTTSARLALQSTELIFGAYESARRVGRVDFPLEIDDNPLEEMVASGRLQPNGGAD